MPNGDLLAVLERILSGEKGVEDVSEKAAIQLSLTALTQIYKWTEEMKDDISSLCIRVTSLEESKKASDKIDELKHKELVSWPYLLQNFVQPVIIAILVAIVTFIIARATK